MVSVGHPLFKQPCGGVCGVVSVGHPLFKKPCGRGGCGVVSVGHPLFKQPCGGVCGVVSVGHPLFKQPCGGVCGVVSVGHPLFKQPCGGVCGAVSVGHPVQTAMWWGVWSGQCWTLVGQCSADWCTWFAGFTSQVRLGRTSLAIFYWALSSPSHVLFGAVFSQPRFVWHHVSVTWQWVGQSAVLSVGRAECCVVGG